MAKLPVTQFLDVVKRSGLVDDERLSAALACVDESVKDSGVIASSLTKAGLLTEWQSEKLLQGKHKGFYLGKYKLLNHIGTGGMGSVYLAEHNVMRHRVAIKLLPQHMASQSSYLERFHQEARASAKLNHPNMVRAIDVDTDNDYTYLVMDYVDGSDLQAIVSRKGPLDYTTAANYIRQAAEGLHYAHEVGLIHRDVKPANLLVDKEGVVKILDMGLARFADDSQASLTKEYDQKMIGTVDYLAPEQALDSHAVDRRADIYSLGCTLYFLLSGDAPFPQGTIPQRLMAHQKEEPADIRKNRPDAPEALLAIRAKMMAKSADDRYQTGAEVVEALSEFLGDREGSGGTATATPAAPIDPTLNENLTLAPLDDEPVGRRLSDSKAGTPRTGSGSKVTGGQGSKVTGSGSGVKDGIAKPGLSGVKKGGSSVVRGAAETSSASGVKSPGKSGVRSPGKSGIKSGGGSEAPIPPVSKLPDLSKAVDLVDELMAASTVPTHTRTAAPLPAARKSEASSGFHIWVVVGVSVAAAGVIGGVFYGLLWALDAVGL
jgi:serine/threonine-protein kinase